MPSLEPVTGLVWDQFWIWAGLAYRFMHSIIGAVCINPCPVSLWSLHILRRIWNVDWNLQVSPLAQQVLKRDCKNNLEESSNHFFMCHIGLGVTASKRFDLNFRESRLPRVLGGYSRAHLALTWKGLKAELLRVMCGSDQQKLPCIRSCLANLEYNRNTTPKATAKILGI